MFLNIKYWQRINNFIVSLINFLKMKNNLLLIIDPQNDFCNPGDSSGKNRGSLYVDGAETDMSRLSDWIKSNKENLDSIYITLDSHQPNDISHSNFWTDKDGNCPSPFTQITSKEVEEGKWFAHFDAKRALNYLKKLEHQAEYPHIIWPNHCIVGSVGAAIYQPLMDAIIEWTLLGNFYKTVVKGTYPYTEHFGAFRAQVPDENVPETMFNKTLLNELAAHQNIYLSGEAKSHCVANTLKQILDEAPDLAKRCIVIEDTMSNVTGFEKLAEALYERAKNMGVRFTTSDKTIS